MQRAMQLQYSGAIQGRTACISDAVFQTLYCRLFQTALQRDIHLINAC